jgi:hypothetical protein
VSRRWRAAASLLTRALVAGVIIGIFAWVLGLGPVHASQVPQERYNGHAIKICADPEHSKNNGVTTGPYRVVDNVFEGKTPGCLLVTGPSSFRVTTSLAVASHVVQSYPYILYGCVWAQCTVGTRFPMRVSAARKLPIWATAYAAGPPGQTGGYQGDFDQYFYKTRSTRVHGAAELVIVTQFGPGRRHPPARHRRHRHRHRAWHWNGHPHCTAFAMMCISAAAHPAVAGVYHDGGIITIGGLRWRFAWWVTQDQNNPSITWPLLFFHLLKPDGHVRIPIGRFVAYVSGSPYRIVPRGWWLGGVRYGFENWVGGKGEAARLMASAPVRSR